MPKVLTHRARKYRSNGCRKPNLDGSLNCNASTSGSATALSPRSRDRKRRHFDYPVMCAYLVYDLSSPVFSSSEIDAIFSPASSTTTSSGPASPTFSVATVSSTSSTTSDGWGPFLNSRIDHITTRAPSTAPTSICIGEFTSASVAHPCAAHGVGQIFHGWDTHPAAKKFKQLIASTPVIKPSNNGPAQILKAYLDEYTGRQDPLSLTWVLKFLLMPKAGGRGKSMPDAQRDWQTLCSPEKLDERDFRPVALICVRREGFAKEELAKKLIQFGKLFSVEVMIVSSIG
ncbi:hypothetical protein EDC01DRAFT_650458 [Geopyxis carbonaria]|nr:hypothetical protein EDC01DRAFT_650458 [Geopyxis carbonaria]